MPMNCRPTANAPILAIVPFTRRWCYVLALGAVLIGPQITLWGQEHDLPVEPVAELPIEFQPYRVLISCDSPTSVVLARPEITEFQRELQDVVEATWGSLWQLQWNDAIQSADNIAQAPETPVDVEFRIRLDFRPYRYAAELTSREPVFSHQSPVLRIEAASRHELQAKVVSSLWGLFRPRARWEPIDAQHAQLRVQGAALAIGDPDLSLLRPTEAFTPWVILQPRGNNATVKANAVPWTLCLLYHQAEGRGVATIVSGLRNALATRPRGRVDLIAVATRAQWPQTELLLKTNVAIPRPLVAHEVLVTPEGEPAPAQVAESVAAEASSTTETSQPALRLISDREGRVWVPRNDATPVNWVKLLSGDQTLAEIPLVPGAMPHLELAVADDLLRLRAEGQLHLLQGELVSVIAERTALQLACRNAAKRQAWTDVDNYLLQAGSLPTAEQMRERVSGIRVPAVAAARAKGDKLAERRVQRMCDETIALIQQHLTDDKLRLLREEMTELRAATADENPTAKP